VALVEWGDAGAPVLGESALEVTLAPGDEEERVRSITLAARGPAWAGRRDEVEGALGFPAVDRRRGSR
jgi:tRNA A37 threonylcarbamoyladenosine biosynthesis protein TsaE